MELRELASFCEVARRLSFNLAASHLGYAQSSISAQIKSLENDLGVRLFDRLGRRITLTPAGQALLPHAQRLVEIEDDARRAVLATTSGAGEPSGTITLSAPESLLTYRLPAVFARFRDRHPGVVVEVRPTPIGRFRGDTRKAVAAGTTQVAFVLDTRLDIRGFESEIVTREPIEVIASPDHPLARADSIAPSELDGATVLYPEAPDSGCVYRGQFERHLAESHATPASSLEFASIETVKQCVASGMGVSALLAVAVASDIASGRLVRLGWTETFETYTQMVWNARSSITPALAAFMDTVRETVGNPG